MSIKNFIKFNYWKFIQNAGSNYSKSKKILLSWEIPKKNSISTVIFSKDRAMQLHALLASFFESKIGECHVVVIFTSSTEAHKRAYKDVVNIFAKSVRFIEQIDYPSFRECLEVVISKLPEGNLFFLVDDIIFTEDVDYKFLASLDVSDTIFSLRMGDHLNFSYVVNMKQQLPKKIKSKDEYLIWKWNEGILDWGYPLSVDGHIFSTTEVLLWIKYLDFVSPSSFENALQRFRYIYCNKQGMSFKKSRIVNIPANKVQNEVNNIHAFIHQDYLLQKWFDGMVIDHSIFRNWINNSVHQEAEFKLIMRNTK